jgi:hypothetical protein
MRHNAQKTEKYGERLHSGYKKASLQQGGKNYSHRPQSAQPLQIGLLAQRAQGAR